MGPCASPSWPPVTAGTSVTCGVRRRRWATRPAPSTSAVSQPPVPPALRRQGPRADKSRGPARLEEAGVPVPPTAACQQADAALDAFHALGGDVVVKPLFGSEGRGMMRIADPDLAWRTFRTLERLQTVLYVQRYIDHPGWDLRVFVLDGRAVAAMRRCSAGGW